jgi:hypothetical protein
MNKPELRHFEQGDVLHLTIAEGKEMQCVEIGQHASPGLGKIMGCSLYSDNPSHWYSRHSILS